ncbi:MAG: hypothetical protein PHI85_10125 [Victivallaceae bacterium]|nr:hypothetical protein [Victivallaceae bacterium]
MIKNLIFSAIVIPAALFASESPLAEKFADYPEVIGTVFELPVTRQEMVDYYTAHADKVPDWLEPPFLSAQKENLARAFIDMREKAVAAEKNGIFPTRERAEKHLRMEIAGLNAAARTELDAGLLAKQRTLDEYVAKVAADPDFQRRAAEADLMQLLADQLKVSDRDIDEYFEKHKYEYSYNPNEYVCYVTYDENGKIVGGEDKPNTLHQRNDVPQAVLAVADKLKEGETSGQFTANGKKLSIKKLPLPDPSIEYRRKRIKNVIESERALDATGALHRLSGVTYNIPMGGIGDFL